MTRPAIFLTHLTWRLASEYAPPPDKIVYSIDEAAFEVVDGEAYPTIIAVLGGDVASHEYWTEGLTPSFRATGLL